MRRARRRFDARSRRFVIDELHTRRYVPLLPCHPRDLIGIALDNAAYMGSPNRLTPELLAGPGTRYFVSIDEADVQSMPGESSEEWLIDAHCPMSSPVAPNGARRRMDGL